MYYTDSNLQPTYWYKNVFSVLDWKQELKYLHFPDIAIFLPFSWKWTLTRVTGLVFTFPAFYQTISNDIEETIKTF